MDYSNGVIHKAVSMASTREHVCWPQKLVNPSDAFPQLATREQKVFFWTDWALKGDHTPQWL